MTQLLLKNTIYFTRRPVHDKKPQKYKWGTKYVPQGYKICTPGVQNFLGYEMSKWGTVGSPDCIY